MTTAQLKLARIAVALIFGLNGLLYANWTSRLPRLQEIYGIDNGKTGFALTCLAIGALVGMPLTGVLIVRYGSRLLTSVSIIMVAVFMPFMAFMPSYFGLLLVMPMFGLFTGMVDIAMNAQAIVIEDGLKKPLMSSFHAYFSVGMFVGAGIAAGLIALGLDAGPHLLTVSGASLLISLWCVRQLLPDAPVETNTEGVKVRKFSITIIYLGVAAFCCMLAEGSMADWTPLYMIKVTLSPESFGPLGQAAYSGAMVVGRFMGDWLRARLGAAAIIRGGAVLAMLGLAIAIFFPTPITAIMGFALVGLGLANIVPIVYSISGKIPGLPAGVGISSVSTLGYSGFLVGPPIIGYIADYQNVLLATGGSWLPGILGLRVGLGFVLFLMVVLLILALFVLKFGEGEKRKEAYERA
jgi:MFS family permease